MSYSNGWPTTKVTLLSRLRDAADHAAWRTFVDLYSPLVYGYCRQRGLQHADAQNVAQEVFSHVSRSIHRFEYDPTRGRFRGWFGLITHQQLLRYRSRYLRGGHAHSGEGSEVAEAFEGEVQGAWVEAFNAHLYSHALTAVRSEFDAETWEAFERVWDRQERPGDVARDLQKDPRWVYQVKHRVVERLKAEIERLTADVAVFHRS